jgi:hypothetical protein
MHTTVRLYPDALVGFFFDYRTSRLVRYSGPVVSRLSVVHGHLTH